MNGRTSRVSIAAEKAREAALEARGYKVIRLTFGELFRTAPFERILRRARLTVAHRMIAAPDGGPATWREVAGPPSGSN